jgi:hypothetical protein
MVGRQGRCFRFLRAVVFFSCFGGTVKAAADEDAATVDQSDIRGLVTAGPDPSGASSD